MVFSFFIRKSSFLDTKHYHNMFFFFLFQLNEESLSAVTHLITVMVRLEWTLFADVQVLGLRRGHLAQTNTQMFEMSSGDFLIQLESKRVDVERERQRKLTDLLREDVDTDFVLILLGEQFNLG